MKNIISVIMSVVSSVLLVVILLLCIMTPEKTKYGRYTDPTLYWTSTEYVSNNF